jgi:hypothetical protein
VAFLSILLIFYCTNCPCKAIKKPSKKPNIWYQQRRELKDGKKNKRPEKVIGFTVLVKR